MTTKFKLTLRADMPPIAWGRPDARLRLLCAVCHGALPEVPLMLWKDDGACASFCDDCVERYIETK
jgi:hypothetical protein